MVSLPELESYLSESTLCILRVVIGIILGFLTFYRRDLSCNREYQTVDTTSLDTAVGGDRESVNHKTANKSWNNSIRKENNRSNLRRRASSSSLPTLGNTPQQTENRRGDPTEELLESAGFLFSGGPFLAIMLAVLDHLILTVFLTSVASVGTLMVRWRRNDDSLSDTTQEYITEQDHSNPQMNTSIHHVAWNAATEYFTSISCKLDTESSTKSPAQSPINIPTRSKSANNITQLSDAQYLELIAMARGYFDISLLPSETIIGIFSFLHPKDLLNYTCSHKRGMRLLDDSIDMNMAAEEQIINNENVNSLQEKDTAMLIWKDLFQRDFAWVLRDWDIGCEALQRSIRLLESDADENALSVHERSNCFKVLHHILSVTGGECNLNNEVFMHHALWSMKEFYFTFAETWLNYTIAGCNSTDKCLIGLHGHIFDISNFVEQHPGSTETLLLQAGRDGKRLC
jgi:cytochrome b involved in lipid metabolism